MSALSWLPIVGPLIDLAGGLVNSGMQSRENSNNRQWQTQENEIMRQREDTAIQRRAADLKAAGINPLLAGSVGGASSQLGNVIQAPLSSAALMSNAINDAGKSLVSALQAQQGIGIEKEKLSLDSARFGLDEKRYKEEVRMNDASIKEGRARIKNIEADTSLKGAQEKAALVSANELELKARDLENLIKAAEKERTFSVGFAKKTVNAYDMAVEETTQRIQSIHDTKIRENF